MFCSGKYGKSVLYHSPTIPQKQEQHDALLPDIRKQHDAILPEIRKQHDAILPTIPQEPNQHDAVLLTNPYGTEQDGNIETAFGGASNTTAVCSSPIAQRVSLSDMENSLPSNPQNESLSIAHNGSPANTTNELPSQTGSIGVDVSSPIAIPETPSPSSARLASVAEVQSYCECIMFGIVRRFFAVGQFAVRKNVSFS